MVHCTVVLDFELIAAQTSLLDCAVPTGEVELALALLLHLQFRVSVVNELVLGALLLVVPVIALPACQL